MRHALRTNFFNSTLTESSEKYAYKHFHEKFESVFKTCATISFLGAWSTFVGKKNLFTFCDFLRDGPTFSIRHLQNRTRYLHTRIFYEKSESVFKTRATILSLGISGKRTPSTAFWAMFSFSSGRTNFFNSTLTESYKISAYTHFSRGIQICIQNTRKYFICRRLVHFSREKNTRENTMSKNEDHTRQIHKI